MCLVGAEQWDGINMKKFIKKIFGIEKLEQEKAAAEKALFDAKVREEAAIEAERIAKLSPKERASAQGEPWVDVLETHVNKENIRNGFFELDWNEQFVLELKRAGYGADGDPDEEIVDRWFRDIVYNMFAEAGMDTGRGAGYINVIPIDKGRSEVS